MKNRVQRQLEIRKIIMEGNMHSQEQLLGELKRRGYDLTQATLSRDLKILQVARVPHPGKGYTYVIPAGETTRSEREQSRVNYLADGFRDLKFSGNLAVMKTVPGYASSIAAVIDAAEPWEIIGTVAGDDTILIIMREGITNSDFKNALITIMPNLKNKI